MSIVVFDFPTFIVVVLFSVLRIKMVVSTPEGRVFPFGRKHEFIIHFFEKFGQHISYSTVILIGVQTM